MFSPNVISKVIEGKKKKWGVILGIKEESTA